jgi:hypothetical protein
MIRTGTAVVMLKPKRGIGGKFVRAFGGRATWFLQTRGSVKTLKTSELSKFIDGWAGVEPGDIGDITDKTVNARALTLTNKNLILLYKKGALRKKDLVIVLPLEFAKTVEEKGGLTGKRLEIGFQVPSEEGKLAEFDFSLFKLSGRENWLNDLNQVIAK